MLQRPHYARLEVLTLEARDCPAVTAGLGSLVLHPLQEDMKQQLSTQTIQVVTPRSGGDPFSFTGRTFQDRSY